MPDNPRVLVIEEHTALRAMLFAVLRHQALDVDTAATAEEALEHVTTCDYALILIDLSLASGDPREFFDDFRRIKPEAETFIIAVRDPNNDIYIDPTMVSAVVTKPLEIDTLADVVRECAAVMPPPPPAEDCPPAESAHLDSVDRGDYLAN
jgi:DNA-binding response OmpR family regulator